MIISEKPVKITSSSDVAQLMWNIINAEHETDKEREHFWVIGLNTGRKVKYVELASLGILDKAFTHPRETFRLAVMRSCHSIIVCHNHPSGDPTPSPEDRKFTATLTAAGKILGIPVLDHVVIGSATEYCSLNNSQPGQYFKTSTKKSVMANKINVNEEAKTFKKKCNDVQKRCDEIEKGIANIEMALEKHVKNSFRKASDRIFKRY